MKKILLLLTIVAWSSIVTIAQEIPKKEFTISVSDNDLAVKPGETKKYEVTLNRSKSYKKTTIDLVIDSTLPDGVTVAFENGADSMINRIMVISVADNVEPFNKAIILKGKSLRASKGVMLNLSTNTEAYTAN
ncbi:hypothetical protein N7E81_16240 [Reichenbachiella carrageenanivorans]|uniref:Uncharacterized protein n=1 Tax=Reichenbachiella carrageenanivorans TaxID=2979869 RepID=A0ABY6CYB7_9BACT|nr:hypothetical protein [Reichenbachiella carrageenanivorans]UXX78906.1 hypothetical protein N7E81_16240 [Reichenbachiella carrageenanivorans]